LIPSQPKKKRTQLIWKEKKVKKKETRRIVLPYDHLTRKTGINLYSSKKGGKKNGSMILAQEDIVV
jgi:hypothetical protein